MNEIWKDINGYEGLYQVSNTGKVKSLVGWNGRKYVPREKILSKTKTSTGYYKVELAKCKTKKSFKVHRLVAMAFIPNEESKPHINHKDGNPLNNNVDNLEWCTPKENIEHAIATGLRKTIQIDPIELKRLYCDEKMSIRDIAEKKGVTPTTIVCKMRKYGIQSRSSGESRNKYHVDLNSLANDLREGVSNKELAEKYGCTTELIATRKYQMKMRGVI